MRYDGRAEPGTHVAGLPATQKMGQLPDVPNGKAHVTFT
jgi:hypothetical protein